MEASEARSKSAAAHRSKSLNTPRDKSGIQDPIEREKAKKKSKLGQRKMNYMGFESRKKILELKAHFFVCCFVIFVLEKGIHNFWYFWLYSKKKQKLWTYTIPTKIRNENKKKKLEMFFRKF